MNKSLKIQHEFVEFIPKVREEGVLYISIPYATAVHNCFCGCQTKVVTPISPVGWQLSFDGESVSLKPSVGNWSFPCRSHYVIKRNTAVWAGEMSDDKIARSRARDRSLREAHFDAEPVQIVKPDPTRQTNQKGGF
jgi:hypothetical protein